jgi:sporulation protein YlmC with PRC-barrel domain
MTFDQYDRSKNEILKFQQVGSNLTAIRVNDSTVSTNKLAITAESVSFSAGAAGTTGVVTLDKAPIYNVDGGLLGSLGDTSFAWVTGTVLTTEVAYTYTSTDAVQLAAMSNGEFAIDYDMGRIRYKKATTGTSDTANYTSR